MSRLNEIQERLRQLDGGEFQKLAEVYLVRKMGWTDLYPYGSQAGTDKAAKGVPDAYAIKDGKYVFVAFTTAQTGSLAKIEKDITDCLDVNKTGVSDEMIDSVVSCHTCFRISPKDDRKLREIDPRVVLISPSEIARDLYYEYRDIAKDILGIGGLPKCMKTVEQYKSQEQKRQLSTPHSLPFRGREREVEDLIEKLSERQIVVVGGKSGSGKTRMALEAVEKYGRENGVGQWVVSGRDYPGDQESVLRELAGMAAIVLVDDANAVPCLSAICDACLENNDLKVILTVRDYAIQYIEDCLRTCVPYYSVRIEALQTEEVKEILREDYGIRNQEYIEQIERISKGNLRLAIMAAMKAKKDGFRAIASAAEIMELFFQDFLSSLSKDELCMLAFYSAAEPCCISCDERYTSFLLGEGFSLDQIRVCLKKYAELEILDYKTGPSGEEAVAFEQQNIKDYLVYRLLFKDKWLSISKLMDSFGQKGLGKLISLLNRVLGVFNDENAFDYLRDEVNSYWNLRKNDKDFNQEDFLGRFYSVLPDIAWEYVTNRVVASGSCEMVDYGSPYDQAKDGAVSPVVKMLYEIGIGEEHDGAFAYIIEYMLHPFEDIGCMKATIENVLGIGVRSLELDFESEIKLVRALSRRAKQTDSNAACLGLRVVEKYPVLEHVETRATSEREIQYARFGMPNSDGALELRGESIRLLLNAALEPSLYERAIGALRRVFTAWCGQIPKEKKSILRHDAEVFFQNADMGDLKRTFTGVQLLVDVKKICERIDAPIPEAMLSYVPTALLDAVNMMLVPKWLEQGEEDQLPCRLWSDCHAIDVARLLIEAHANGHIEDYDIRQVLDRLALGARDEYRSTWYYEELFGAVAEGKAGLYRLLWGTGLFHCFVSALGIDRLRTHAIKTCDWDLHTMLILEISPERLTGCDLDEVASGPQRYPALCDFQWIIKVEQGHEGYAKRYCDAVSASLLEDGNLAESFFRADKDDSSLREFLDRGYFEDGILESIFLAHLPQLHFDYFGTLFAHLFRLDNKIVRRMIDKTETMDYRSRLTSLQRISQLFLFGDDIDDVLRDAVNYLGRIEQGITGYTVAHMLDGGWFGIGPDASLAFCKRTILQDVSNSDYADLLSYVIGEAPLSWREELLREVSIADREGALLGHISIRAHSYSSVGNDNGFIRQHEAEYDALDRIKRALPEDPCYLKHKLHLGKEQAAMRRAIEWEKFHQLLDTW